MTPGISPRQVSGDTSTRLSNSMIDNKTLCFIHQIVQFQVRKEIMNCSPLIAIQTSDIKMNHLHSSSTKGHSQGETNNQDSIIVLQVYHLQSTMTCSKLKQTNDSSKNLSTQRGATYSHTQQSQLMSLYEHKLKKHSQIISIQGCPAQDGQSPKLNLRCLLISRPIVKVN